MPKEYIDREVLMSFPIRKNHYDEEHGNEHFINGIETVFEYAESLPAADVVEVVRCKDCKHLGIDECGTFCKIRYLMTELEDFCNYGERKEDKN